MKVHAYKAWNPFNATDLTWCGRRFEIATNRVSLPWIQKPTCKQCKRCLKLAPKRKGKR